MSAASLPEWYDDGPLVDVICRAETAGAGTDEIVDVISNQRYDESPRRRVQRIVETTLERTDQRRSVPRSTQLRQTDEAPPSPPLARLEETDIEYLSSREFARLLRVALGRFGGSVEQLDAGDPDSAIRGQVSHSAATTRHLRWQREGETTVVIVLSQTESQVDEEAVETIRQRFATLSVDADRAVLVTNGVATEEARAAAKDAAVQFSDRQALANVLELARITPAVYGDILERGENPTFEWSEVVEELPDPPTELSEVDPFDAEAASSGRHGRLSVTQEGERDESEAGDSGGREKATFSAQGDSVEVNPEALGKLQTAGSVATETDDDAIDGLLSNLSKGS